MANSLEALNRFRTIPDTHLVPDLRPVSHFKDDISLHSNTPLEVLIVNTFPIEVGNEMVVALLNMFNAHQGPDMVENVPVRIRIVIVIQSLIVETAQARRRGEEDQMDQVAEMIRVRLDFFLLFHELPLLIPHFIHGLCGFQIHKKFVHEMTTSNAEFRKFATVRHLLGIDHEGFFLGDVRVSIVQKTVPPGKK